MLRLLKSFEFVKGSSFDLLAGVDLWFDGDGDDDFSFFDYVVGDFLNEDWTISVETKPLISEITTGVSANPLSLLSAPAQSFEVLTATYSGKTLPVPLPGTLLLYGSCLAFGMGGRSLLRRRASRKAKA